MESIASVLDLVVFVLILVPVIYLFTFALFAQKRKPVPYPAAEKNHHFLILFPAYKEDKVIVESVRDFYKQNYPSHLYKVVVISDGMKEVTESKLRSLSAGVIKANFENSSKAAALNLAIAERGNNSYDMVVIMDADNITTPDFLSKINDAYDAGILAMQAHRTAKGGNTEVAILDKVSEEINNSIYREGHVRAGLSSALIGSGLAIDYDWFARNIPLVTSAGEDKELELLLLKDGIFIDYLQYLYVYDEKVTTVPAYYKQRRRWMAAQLDLLRKGIRDLPKAVATGNIDYCDKLFQWMIPPRIVLTGFILLVSIAWVLVNWTVSLKWWFIFLMLLSALSLAMPDELYGSPFKKALWKLPVLFILSLVNLFNGRNVNKRFIHTQHGEEIK